MLQVSAPTGAWLTRGFGEFSANDMTQAITARRAGDQPESPAVTDKSNGRRIPSLVTVRDEVVGAMYLAAIYAEAGDRLTSEVLTREAASGREIIDGWFRRRGQPGLNWETNSNGGPGSWKPDTRIWRKGAYSPAHEKWTAGIAYLRRRGWTHLADSVQDDYDRIIAACRAYKADGRLWLSYTELARTIWAKRACPHCGGPL